MKNNPHLNRRYQFLRKKFTLDDIKKFNTTYTPEFGIIYTKYGKEKLVFKVSKKLASKLGFILSQSNELHIKVEVESTSNKQKGCIFQF